MIDENQQCRHDRLRAAMGVDKRPQSLSSTRLLKAGDRVVEFTESQKLWGKGRVCCRLFQRIGPESRGYRGMAQPGYDRTAPGYRAGTLVADKIFPTTP